MRGQSGSRAEHSQKMGSAITALLRQSVETQIGVEVRLDLLANPVEYPRRQGRSASLGVQMGGAFKQQITAGKGVSEGIDIKPA